MWCHHCYVSVSSISCHSCCCYIFTTTNVIVLILTKLETTQIKPKDWILLSKSLFNWNTPQLFSMVSSLIGDQYKGATNSHKCKPPTDKIPSQKYKRVRNISLSGWYRRDLTWWWAKVATLMATRSNRLDCVLLSLFCYCFFNNCHYRCRYIFTTNSATVSILTKLPTTHI